MNGIGGLIAYLLLVNVVAYIMMGIDKKRAINKQWRISEKTLWIIALIGGSTGSLFGMKSYRHKTKHASFKYGLPLLTIVQVILIVYYFVER